MGDDGRNFSHVEVHVASSTEHRWSRFHTGSAGFLRGTALLRLLLRTLCLRLGTRGFLRRLLRSGLGRRSGLARTRLLHLWRWRIFLLSDRRERNENAGENKTANKSLHLHPWMCVLSPGRKEERGPSILLSGPRNVAPGAYWTFCTRAMSFCARFSSDSDQRTRPVMPQFFSTA